MTGLAATSLASAQKKVSANDKVRLGFIGVGNRGSQLIDAFNEHEDKEIVAICDVFTPYLDKQKERLGGKVETYTDFRKIIEHPGIDAVVIATPDHWHAIQTIDACNAGKDV
mgnify:CR=1 FL=1